MTVDMAAERRQRLERLQQRVAGWSVRLRSAGLDGLAETLLDVAEPLGPVGAQLLWVVQPALGLVMPSAVDDLGSLADLLDDPAGVAWLRSALAGVDEAEDEPED
jgi:hypothetical protein